jgi:hypothetical protein
MPAGAGRAICVVVSVMKSCAIGFDVSARVGTESDFGERCRAQNDLRYRGEYRRNASQSCAQLDAHSRNHARLTLAALKVRGKRNSHQLSAIS